jgi:tetratricopeptide (TPR) repeat protein
MNDNLAQKSIDCALCCNWKEAIKINLEILKDDPEDIDALNRLAKAYFENNEANKAIKTSKEVLKISPSNNIANNSLERFKKTNPNKKSQTKIDMSSFIEEPGKTKLTTLINLGSEKVYSYLNTGDELLLSTHAHKVSITTLDNKYIGKITDDLSARMRILIKSGKKFSVFIKSVNKNSVKIFIKGDTLSFPLEKSESLSEFST